MVMGEDLSWADFVRAFTINEVWTRAAFTRKASIELPMTAAFVVQADAGLKMLRGLKECLN
jgi:hypothetical protein